MHKASIHPLGVQNMGDEFAFDAFFYNIQR